MKIKTLTTGDGVTTTAEIQWLPAYIYYIAATQLTSIKVNIEGDGVLLDLPAAGLNAVSGIRRFGAVANSYLIPLANGFVPNKTVTMTFVNSAAQTPDIFAYGLQKGSFYFVTQQMKVLANSGKTISGFQHMGFSDVGATDELTLKFIDGHVQKMTAEELLAWYTLFSNETDSKCIDNLSGSVVEVNFIPAVDRTLYITRQQRIGNIF